MLGSRLKKCRLVAGMTQQQLADKLNLSRSTISKYECNIIKPNIQRRIQMCFCLNASADFLLDIAKGKTNGIIDTERPLNTEEIDKITALINAWFF